MTERALIASIDGKVVGTLRADHDIWSFEYDARWLADPKGFPLSPALPLDDPIVDGSAHRPVQWFFDNLLPEEAQRTLMARDAGPR
ncbi:HipA N-terminal domain-containing protein [Cupriavidus agavae]|uniref:HipA-like protein n=1 Tax=Cupriavidus agavae TaxID=1001822 RepID=A0A4Q7R871_9BURK|nr:HipA N-terminal domain-containing protein [Cupriavidus agavae]RZT29045.1 HipA-like protein [Cupriavidus agavae]